MISSESEQREIESKFLRFKASISESAFSDAHELIRQAKIIADDDVALAYRISQRARNLQPDSASVISVYQSLKKQMRRPWSGKNDKVSGLLRSARLKKRAENARKLVEKKWEILPRKLRTPFVLLFIMPWLIFSFYQLFIASPRYESRAQLVVKQPDASSTMDPAMAILSGFGASNLGGDAQLVLAYVHSRDMLEYLEANLRLTEHYSSNSIDIFSRLRATNEVESLLAFYQAHTEAVVASESNIISIGVQAFDPEFAQKLSKVIVERAEWFINSIGHQLAEEQLYFAKNEHALVEQKLQSAKAKLLEFQQEYNLLDPAAEGVAMQQIAYRIENQLSLKQAELRALLSVMSEGAPEVMSVRSELEALAAQLELERSRLSKPRVDEGGERLSVGQVVSRYSELRVAMELALQAYTSSLISLEKSRVEAYRKLQYLVTVEAPTLPQGASYPKTFYNISLFAVLGVIIFGVVRIVFATFRELTI